MFQFEGGRYPFTKSFTLYIILINLAAFVLQLFISGFTRLFALTPAMAFSGYFYQFFTYMFMHGGLSHIFFNMFVFAIFGFPVERILGRNRFLVVYFLSGIGSSLLYIAFTGVSDIPLLGASGAVFGILAAYAFKFPKNWIYIFGLFPMPAWLLIIFLMIEETFLGLLGLQPGVANFGHIGGIITGLLIMALWRIREREKGSKEFGERDFEFIWE